MINLSDANFWFNFSHEIDEKSEIECSECKEYSNIQQWTDGYAYCEDCGDHNAIVCPKCDWPIDHIWCPVLNVRQPEDK